MFFDDGSHYNFHSYTFFCFLRNVFIYTKSKKLQNVFIYKNVDTFQIARQFPLGFYIQKAIHLTLQDFHENFEVGIYIQKA